MLKRSLCPNEIYLKPSIRILSLLAIFFFAASSVFGDDATNYYNSGLAKSFKPANKPDLDGAIVDFNKAIELKPDDADFYNSRGIVKARKGDTDGSLADFKRAIELKSDDAGPYFNRCMVEMSMADWKAALADCNKLIELEPHVFIHYHNRGNVEASRAIWTVLWLITPKRLDSNLTMLTPTINVAF